MFCNERSAGGGLDEKEQRCRSCLRKNPPDRERLYAVVSKLKKIFVKRSFIVSLARYQKFEYAIGHWLQKATEHMLGCVLCRLKPFSNVSHCPDPDHQPGMFLSVPSQGSDGRECDAHLHHCCQPAEALCPVRPGCHNSSLWLNWIRVRTDGSALFYSSKDGELNTRLRATPSQPARR